MATIRKKIQTVPRSPKASSGIRPVGDNSTAYQEYLVSGDYYPDRTLTPLILQPFCSYVDALTGKYIENAMPEVTDGVWYRLTDTNRHLGLCAATMIDFSQTGTDTNGSAITVFSVASTPGSADYGKLTVRENITVGEDVTYVFEGTLTTDGRLLREYFNTRCDSADEVPDILLDNNPTCLYDPLHDPQYYTVNPSLSIDLPVVWKWMSYHELEGGWVTLGSTQLDWCIDRVGDGIKIDRSVMPDMIMLRCIAQVTIDGTTVEIERTVTHTRLMPDYDVRMTRIGEMTEDVDAICPYAYIECGGQEVTDTSELAVIWTNSSGTRVGEGINPTIRLSSLNADRMLNLDVKDRGGNVLLMADGCLLTDNGVLLRTRSKTNY